MKKVSIILLDWDVRESYHSIEYLNKQEYIRRSDFEVIWIEYFNKKVKVLSDYAKRGFIDKYIVLGRKGVYRKHVMYNEGVLISKGEIVVISDSDAMYASTFVRSVIDCFAENPNIVLYLDEIRNSNPCFYPFRFPDWDEVLNTPGLINWDYRKKRTVGLVEDDEKLKAKHGFGVINLRNYGACFCARRKDIIRVGGFDEHETYDGHVCGPYELGWRLVNAGFKEAWHQNEFLMHVYHPWISVERDVIGPHIRFNSATALKHKEDGTIFPIVENETIKKLRTGVVKHDRDNSVKVSVIIYSKKPDLWSRICDAIGRATQTSYEVIFVGPTPPSFSRPDMIWIETKVKPVQCYEIGIRAAKGKFVCWLKDNCLLKAGSVDAAIKMIRVIEDGRIIVVFKYLETYNSGVSWHDGNHESVLNDIVSAEFGIIPKSYFIRLGGFDNRFIESCAETDLCARATMDGAIVKICEDSNLDVRRENVDLLLRNNPLDAEMLNMLWNRNDKNAKTCKLKRLPVQCFQESKDFHTKSQGETGPARFELVDKHNQRIEKLDTQEMEKIMRLVSEVNSILDKSDINKQCLKKTKNAVKEIINKIEIGFLFYLSQTGNGLQCMYDLARKLNARDLTDESVSLYLYLIENIPLLVANRTVNEGGLSSSFFPACSYDLGLIFYEKNDLRSAIKYLAQCLVVLPTAPKARMLFDRICKVYVLNK
jgi:GT2 family glycosyltransferase